MCGVSEQVSAQEALVCTKQQVEAGVGVNRGDA